MKRIVIIFLTFFLASVPCYAKLNIGITLDPPFVMKGTVKQYTGISIVIWEAIANELNLDYQYYLFENEDKVIKAYQEDKLDLIVSPIPVTYDLLKTISFSRPYFIYKIGLLLPELPTSFWSAFKDLSRMTFIPFLLAFLTITLIFALILAIFEYYWHKKTWFKHFTDAFLNALSGLFSVGYIYYPESRILKFLCVLWLLVGLSFIAIFSATVTSSMLISHTRLGLNVEKISHIEEKKVAIDKYSPIVEVFKANDIQMIYITSFNEGLALLQNKEVDAVVANNVTIKHHFHDQLHRYELKDIIVGATELAFPVKAPELRQKINEALTKLQDKNKLYSLCERFIQDDANLCLI